MIKTHHSPIPWNHDRPTALVVACSDGRFQEHVDEFLSKVLGIAHYDRLYAPGGPGALAHGEEVSRPFLFNKECRSLVSLHGIKEVVLLFHGPAADGPDEACCGDYRRRMTGQSASTIRERQEHDAAEVVAAGMGKDVRVSAYRCEVCKDGSIAFVPLAD